MTRRTLKPHHYDLIVIGSGSGLDVANICANRGMKVAIIEEGPLGGTCLNRGCIPSKMYIHVADVAETIRESNRFGIHSKITKIDFGSIVRRVRGVVDGESKTIEQSLKKLVKPKLYQDHAEFIGRKTLRVGDETLSAEKILIAAGARTAIPPIPGLNTVPYLTSESALKPKRLPKSLTIIGGGYIAAELAHFYGSLGSKITIIERGNLLLSREDRDISTKFTEVFSKKYDVLLGFGVTEVKKNGREIVATAQSTDKKTIKQVRSEALLVATGIQPNTDLLRVDQTGVKINQAGFIEADELLETNIKGIFTLGDIHGRFVFKHSANHEAGYVIHNLLHPQHKLAADYTAMPHAVFSSPQIAGVGLTEQELEEKKIHYQVAAWPYIRTGMGEALLDRDGFVKFLYEPKTYKILGCHILGSQASTLIHEVLVVMKAGDGTLRSLRRTVHIHPALSEVLQRAAGNID